MASDLGERQHAARALHVTTGLPGDFQAVDNAPEFEDRAAEVGLGPACENVHEHALQPWNEVWVQRAWWCVVFSACLCQWQWLAYASEVFWGHRLLLHSVHLSQNGRHPSLNALHLQCLHRRLV